MKAGMTSKERVLSALAHQEPDRVPVDYYLCNSGIDNRLKRHFGLKESDGAGLLEALGTDFRGVAAPYVGPRLHPEDPAGVVNVEPCFGVRCRWVEHGSGGYWDYCDFPLKEASYDEIAAWPMPSPDDFDYSVIAKSCRGNGEFCVCAGGGHVGDIINSNGFLRGMEQTLVDLITEDPAGMLLAERRCKIWLEVMERTLAAAEGGIDVFNMGEDLGTQTGPIINPELYRKVIRPFHQRFVDLAKSYDLPIVIHSCGSSSWAFDDFIEMGIDCVETLQPEAKDMAPDYLKRRYGGRLAFKGMISTAGPLAYGSAGEVEDIVRRTLETMMPGGGYVLAPTHAVQDNTPVENVLSMFGAARGFGSYPRV